MHFKTPEIALARVFISKLPGGEYLPNPQFLTAVVSPAVPEKKKKVVKSFLSVPMRSVYLLDTRMQLFSTREHKDSCLALRG